MLLPCISAHQKRAPDLITDGCEPPCGCWELNSGPLEQQSVLLTSEPPLQFPGYLIFKFIFNLKSEAFERDLKTLVDFYKMYLTCDFQGKNSFMIQGGKLC
ncbi:uncharacterized protein LOC100689233 [Cricetulus griseus]|uniref:Csr1 n=1 Tax=Cricetulus griseus TaxID=10029 RepID=Q8R4C3_CRIGR|nr:uncharacterized protein LOC100689233 [Cricetulus griseus]AAL90860.1 Csr1 [Cricetulus griseus]